MILICLLKIYGLGQDSYEKAERKLLEHACEIAIKIWNQKEDVEFFSGDLINQIISSSFAARTLEIPYLGIYGACSSSMEGLALASLWWIPNLQKCPGGYLSAIMRHVKSSIDILQSMGTKPPTAQWTVTGAGAAIVAQEGEGPRVVCATIGRVVDMGLSDPFNMGAAMAPAAVDTITAHIKDLNIDLSYYDVIATGDLGRVGHDLAVELLKKHGINFPEEKFTDCGMIIYKDEQPVFSGGSGCGCAAVTTYGHFINRMKKGELKKILVVATGALLSPMSYQQNESIPCVAHAVSIEI